MSLEWWQIGTTSYISTIIVSINIIRSFELLMFLSIGSKLIVFPCLGSNQHSISAKVPNHWVVLK